MNMKFFLKCNEAVHVCDKAQYEEASPFERFLLKVHLFFCKICRGYSSKNVKLSNAVESSHIKILQEEQKQLLKERLQREIDKS
jgi:hypothetical protein